MQLYQRVTFHMLEYCSANCRIKGYFFHNVCIHKALLLLIALASSCHDSIFLES